MTVEAAGERGYTVAYRPRSLVAAIFDALGDRDETGRYDASMTFDEAQSEAFDANWEDLQHRYSVVRVVSKEQES